MQEKIKGRLCESRLLASSSHGDEFSQPSLFLFVHICRTENGPCLFCPPSINWDLTPAGSTRFPDPQNGFGDAERISPVQRSHPYFRTKLAKMDAVSSILGYGKFSQLPIISTLG